MPSQIVRYEDRAEIVTAKGERFVIDLEDVEKVQGRSWCRSHRYAATCVRKENGGRTLISLHRFLMNAASDREIDHIDGDTANNRRSNLRPCQRCMNTKNLGRPSSNTSGFKGVSWHKRGQKWRACIQINRKQKHLGLFDTPEQASAAYQAAAERLFGDFKRAQEHE